MMRNKNSFQQSFSRRNFMGLLSLSTASLLCACSDFRGRQTDSSVDAGKHKEAGSSATKNNNPFSELKANSRVVALSKSTADLWLLSGGSLVGATDDALELPYINDGVVSVGSYGRPNSEAIISLDPDLVLLTSDMPSQKKLIDSFEALGQAYVDVQYDNFEDYAHLMLLLCAQTEHKDLYKKNVEDIKDKIDTICVGAKKLPERSFLALRVSSTKNTILKFDHFACDICSDLHLKNVADDNLDLTTLSLEAIVAEDPYYIFVIPQGQSEEAKQAYQDAFADDPAWRALSAYQHKRIHMLPKELFQYKPNAEWDQAYEYISDIRADQG